MTQFVLLPKLFFFGFFFQCVGVCYVSASSSSVSWKPLATTARAQTRSPRRRDPGSNPGPRRRDDTPSRLVHVSCGLTHLGRFDAARPRPSAGRRVDASPRTRVRPGVDFVDPPRRRHSRVRRGGYSSRTTPRRSGRSPITDRSIVHLRSSPPPRVARRSEGVGGECVINRFAARPLGSPSRRRRRVASSSSSRDAAARGLVLVERSFVLLFLLIATAASALLDPSARRPVASVVWCPGT